MDCVLVVVGLLTKNRAQLLLRTLQTPLGLRIPTRLKSCSRLARRCQIHNGGNWYNLTSGILAVSAEPSSMGI